MSREGRLLFWASFILVGFGLVMVYSSSAVVAAEQYKHASYYLTRQSLFAALGVAAFFLVASIPLNFYKDHARTIMFCAIGLTLLVFVPGLGRSAGGARRWISLGGFNIQPAEFVKLAACIYLANYLSRKVSVVQKGTLSVYIPPAILIGLVCLLVLVQPDLGSFAFLVILTSLAFFVTGLPVRFVAIALGVLIPAFYFLIVRVPYRMKRLEAYLNPWDDPQGKGFQIIQSLLSFALGGTTGAGLGQGTQKLYYLPSGHNDFIFAVIGEELGLFGTCFVLAAFLVIFYAVVKIASRRQQIFEKLLVLLLGYYLVIQAMIHMMVCTGLVPTKGLPLPFISYGGSALIANMIAVGLIIACDRHTRVEWKPQ
ncbi:MAG TPA: putative lipid II flippase FtsW [Candidatus Omnitrophota bacterium]|nr:putative lipid II flippase FtsW [Candidatus Omnitrophota bacterium]